MASGFRSTRLRLPGLFPASRMAFGTGAALLLLTACRSPSRERNVPGHPDAAAGAPAAATPEPTPSDAGTDAARRADPTRVVDLASAEGDHTCALQADGAVWCWGANAAGQLGDGTTTSRGRPVRVQVAARVVRIAAGPASTCAIDGDGVVTCWGHVVGGRAVPTAIAGLPAAAAVTVGRAAACAVLLDGSARCWRVRFATGEDGHVVRPGAHEPPEVLAGAERLRDIASNDERFCGVRDDGIVLCWTVPVDAGVEPEPPAPAPGSAGTVRVALGASIACALRGDGVVRCWRHGRGPLVLSEAARRVALDVAAAGHNACLVLDGGTVRCRGVGADGQLGSGAIQAWSEEFLEVQGIAGARRVVLGASHACALLDDGAIRCWGSDLEGQLGDGAEPGSHGPITVPGLAGVVHLAAGGDGTCAALEDGTARCWGDNRHGRVGDGTRTDRASPTPVAGLDQATQISMGQTRACARRRDGTVWCWGDPFRGSGDPWNAGTPPPAASLPGLDSVAEVDIEDVGCVRREDGTVGCWRDCGGAGPDDPVLGNAVEIAVGVEVRCARSADGTVRCWFCDCGEAVTCGGEGEPVRPTVVRTFLSRRSEAARLAGVSRSRAIDLSIAEYVGCALLEGGVAACWRSDLGPLPPTGLVDKDIREVAGVDLVAAGDGASCVRLAADGTVQCWGDRPAPLEPDRLTPFDAFRGAVQIAIGTDHVCALMPDATVRCWGGWNHGQLGDGVLGYRSAPVSVLR